MKIWKEFGSSHSGNISVIGTFVDDEQAQQAYDMIVDFTLGEWEERYASVEEYLAAWSEKFHPDLKYASISASDYSIGVDDEPDFEIDGNQIKVLRIRTENIGGIVKLFLYAGAKNADVTNHNK